MKLYSNSAGIFIEQNPYFACTHGIHCKGLHKKGAFCHVLMSPVDSSGFLFQTIRRIRVKICFYAKFDVKYR